MLWCLKSGILRLKKEVFVVIRKEFFYGFLEQIEFE